MEVFEAKAKKWGNSVGFVIPRHIVQEEDIKAEKTFRVMILPKEPLGKRIWGILESNIPTQELLDEVDRDFNK